MTMVNVLALELALFLGLLLLMEIGYRLAQKGILDPSTTAAVSSVYSVVQALVGLILAFSFAGAGARLDSYRDSIVAEAIAIETAWDGTQLLPGESRAPARDLLRAYLDTRIGGYAALPDDDLYDRFLAQSQQLEKEIWSRLVTVTEGRADLRLHLFPAVWAMSEARTKRTVALRTHTTEMTTAFMIGLVMVASLLIGSSLAVGTGRNRSYRLIYAGVVSTALHVIIDMEFPRTGLVATRAADNLLIELRQTMR
jgi:hypothetical protein